MSLLILARPISSLLTGMIALYILLYSCKDPLAIYFKSQTLTVLLNTLKIPSLSSHKFPLYFIVFSYLIGETLSSIFDYFIAGYAFRSDQLESIDADYIETINPNPKTKYRALLFNIICILFQVRPRSQNNSLHDTPIPNRVNPHIRYSMMVNAANTNPSIFLLSETYYNLHRFLGGTSVAIYVSIIVLSSYMLLSYKLLSKSPSLTNLMDLSILGLSYTVIFYSAVKSREHANKLLYFAGT